MFYKKTRSVYHHAQMTLENIRTRTYIKLGKGHRVLTQSEQKTPHNKKQNKQPPSKKNPLYIYILYKLFLGAQIVSRPCYFQTRPITLHTEKLFCVFGWNWQVCRVLAENNFNKTERECKQSNLRKRCLVTIQIMTTMNLHF